MVNAPRYSAVEEAGSKLAGLADMALTDAEHEELLEMLRQTRDAAKQLGDGWAQAVEKCNQFRAATISAAETAQMAIERLQRQEALVNAALRWRANKTDARYHDLFDLGVAVDNYNKYLKERS